MTIEPPIYEEGDTAYLKESAALGFLEAVTISGITRDKGKWLYAIRAGVSRPTAPSHYGDRASLVNAKTLFFTESELISVCDALALAEANAQRVLDRLQAQKASICPSTE